MKKVISVLGLLLIVASPIVVLSAPSLSARLKGKILLAVEDKGKTYFVNDDGNKYLITKDTAQKIFEKLGIVISNKDLAQIPEKKLGIENIATTSQNYCEQKIVEKIVYQEKIVEKPVYINNCSNVTNNQSQTPTTTTYSEYKPTYEIKDRYDGETTSRNGRLKIVVFNNFTARNISIKKMVFRSVESAGDLRLTFDTNDSTTKMGARPRQFGEFYLSGSNKFIYKTEVAITNYPFSITVIADSIDKAIEPVMSEWELWDNTDNKPVKIQ